VIFGLDSPILSGFGGVGFDVGIAYNEPDVLGVVNSGDFNQGE